MINNEKAILANLLTEEFKECLKELVCGNVKLINSSENISIEFDYKEFFVIIDCAVSNEYIEEEGDGYYEPRQGGYEVENIQFSNLKIYYDEIEISENEINIIIKFLNK